jgi:hypothetical protein
MVFCSLIASSAMRAFISALKLRRCLDFISAPSLRQRFYTLMSGPNFGEHFSKTVFMNDDYDAALEKRWKAVEKKMQEEKQERKH